MSTHPQRTVIHPDIDLHDLRDSRRLQFHDLHLVLQISDINLETFQVVPFLVVRGDRVAINYEQKKNVSRKRRLTQKEKKK